MPRLYLLTDRAGSWPFVTEDELAERLAGGRIAAQLVGIFEDDSEGWMRLGDEITRVVESHASPNSSSLRGEGTAGWSSTVFRGRRPSVWRRSSGAH